MHPRSESEPDPIAISLIVPASNQSELIAEVINDRPATQIAERSEEGTT